MEKTPENVAQLKLDNLRKLEQKYAFSAPWGADHVRVQNQIKELEKEMNSQTLTTLPSQIADRFSDRREAVEESYDKLKTATAFNTASRWGFLPWGEKWVPTQVLAQNVAKINDEIATKVAALEASKQKDLSALEQSEASLVWSALQAAENIRVQSDAQKATQDYNDRLIKLQEETAKYNQNQASNYINTSKNMANAIRQPATKKATATESKDYSSNGLIKTTYSYNWIEVYQTPKGEYTYFDWKTWRMLNVPKTIPATWAK